MTVGGAAAAIAEGIPHVHAVTGVFMDRVGELGRVRADDTGEDVLASKAIADWPSPGTRVWLLTVGSAHLMLDAPGSSSWGVVNAVGTGTAVVEYPEGSGQLATYTVARGASVVVGDRARLDHGLRVIIAAYPTATPPPPLFELPTTRPRQAREAEVNAQWDGTAMPSGSWLTGDLLYTRNVNGGPNYATMGYGDAITRLGINPDSITDAAVFLARHRVGSAHTGGTHTLGGRSGLPAPADTFAVEPTDGWLTIPLAAARALASGTARGLTFYGGGGTVLRGLRASPGNGRLRLRYSVEV